MTIQKVEVKEPEELKSEYSDNQFWNVDKKLDDTDVDALLAELEDWEYKYYKLWEHTQFSEIDATIIKRLLSGKA